jgi:cytochrome c55X
MRRALPLLGALALLGTVASAEPDAQRQRELSNMLRHDCGSCHGLTLAGGLGPPLTSQALAGYTREGLIATIRHGRPGTPMPPWAELLSDEDVEWLVDAMLAEVKHHD